MSETEDELYRELLEKHIERKVSAALKRRFDHRSPESADIELGSDSFGPSVSGTNFNGDIVPPFDPDDKTLTVTGWLQKLDQLGEIHHWTDYHKTSFMQQKLRGSARNWFNRLDDYRKTWPEWKTALTRAFPRCTDYATVLEELVARRKKFGETMTRYYHDKLALIQQCRLDDEAAISCLIKGLPLELQANARAFQCTTPDELYAGFIAPLENYESPRESRRESSVKKPRFEENSGQKQCYNCGKAGHIVKDCRLKGLVRCYFCNRVGHKKEECRLRRAKSANNPDGTDAKTIKLVNSREIQNVYTKKCLMNGHSVFAYLDSGSQVNIIHYNLVGKWNIPTCSVSTTLKAFGGSTIHVQREAKFLLQIDDLRMETTALVTNADMDNLELILGQPIINAEGISLVVSAGSAKLIKNSDCELINDINLDAVKVRPQIVISEDVMLNPNSTTVVGVNINNVDSSDDIYMDSKRFQIGRNLICIPGVVLHGFKGAVPVTIIGDQQVTWKMGKLIGRGCKCVDAREPESYKVSLINRNECSKSFTEEEIDMNTDLDVATKNSLLDILNNWRGCFAENSAELGTVKGCELEIKLTDESKAICYRPYRLPLKEREIVRDKVRELLDSGIIRESHSDFASPIVLVRKKDNSYRLCCDYRAVNKATIKQVYPMPNIEEQLNLLGGKLYFTSLDCNQGFHQIAVESKSIPKTAFVTPDGHYEFLKMPFGLVNAPAVFQRAINNTLGNLRFSQVLVYMDDLLLPSTSADEGLKLLDTVLQILNQSGFKLKLKKCSFLKGSINFLGHEIGPNGISPGLAKVECVKKFKRPENAHEIRQFLGLAGYFRKFVENFAVIALPLTKLTRKNVTFEWGENQEASFCKLKEMLIGKPILVPFNPQLEIQIHTDASSKGLGGIFFQVQPDKSLKPVAYFSRVTSSAEQVYHSYELETLAVIESLKRFRIYLIGQKFKIITDCAAVRYTFSKKDLVARIARWWLSIQDYNFEIEHRPGLAMKHVDALSRNPCNILQIEIEDWFLTIQLQDDTIRNIVNQLKNKSDKHLTKEFVYKNNRLYRKTLLGERLVIPKFARFQLLRKYHDDVGHPGFDRCLNLIKDQFWFAKMTRFVKKYVNSCLNCGYSKGNYGKTEGFLCPISKPNLPMETVHIDHVGPFPKTKTGFAYILTIVDSFTKYLVARPSKTLGSAECIKNLREIFSEYLGYPRRIVSDNGLAFTSRYFKEFTNNKQIKHVLTATATPRANGQVERYHRTLLDALRSVSSDDDRNWDDKIPEVIWGMNNTVNSSTKHTPFELLFGYKGNVLGNLEVRPTSTEFNIKRDQAHRNLSGVAKKMKSHYDKKRKAPRKYVKGDLVLWNGGISCNEKGVNKKLNRKYSGPYKVEKVFNGDRYKIRSVKGMRGYKAFSTLVAVDSLRPYRACLGDSDLSDSDENIRDREDLIDLLES